MILLELFLSFCKVGFSSFGGLSMVPLINSEMLAHGWMTTAELSDIVAIAEMTPGPFGLNCAIFAGTRAAGLPGAIFASLGTLSPTFLICSVAAFTFERFKDSDFMQKAMFGIRPGSLGLIVGVLVSLSLSNYVTTAGSFHPAAAWIGLFSLVALLRWKWSIPLVILLSALLGLVLVR